MKLIKIALVVSLAVALSACAGTSAKQNAKVKCPACGYEFNVDS